jgi:DNA-binding transcriptional LysR family regulator
MIQRGVIRLSAPEGFANFFFSQQMGAFFEHHPNISLELVTIQQIMSLSRKEADIAVTLDPPKAGPYRTEKITDYTLNVYASRELSRPGGDRFANVTISWRIRFIGYIQDMILCAGPGLPRRRPPGNQAAIPELQHICPAHCNEERGSAFVCYPIFIARRQPDLQNRPAARDNPHSQLLARLPPRPQQCAASAVRVGLHLRCSAGTPGCFPASPSTAETAPGTGTSRRAT